MTATIILAAGAVEADIRAWVHAVKPGGMLCGDNWGIDDVQQAVRSCYGDLLMAWPLPVVSVHEIWWTRRPDA